MCIFVCLCEQKCVHLREVGNLLHSRERSCSAPCSSISEAAEGVESSGGARCNLFPHRMMFCPKWLEF